MSKSCKTGKHFHAELLKCKRIGEAECSLPCAPDDIFKPPKEDKKSRGKPDKTGAKMDIDLLHTNGTAIAPDEGAVDVGSGANDSGNLPVDKKNVPDDNVVKPDSGGDKPVKPVPTTNATETSTNRTSEGGEKLVPDVVDKVLTTESPADIDKEPVDIVTTVKLKPSTTTESTTEKTTTQTTTTLSSTTEYKSTSTKKIIVDVPSKDPPYHVITESEQPIAPTNASLIAGKKYLYL